jgi:transcription elongation factor GreA
MGVGAGLAAVLGPRQGFSLDSGPVGRLASAAPVFLFLLEKVSMALDFVEKLRQEIKTLEYELHNELPKEIQRARELGDLSENAEYSAAKERQDLVGARLAQLKRRLAELSMIDFTKIPRDVAGLGSTMIVYDINNDKEMTIRLVTSEEADAPNGQISTTSPIGRALLGKKEGDVAEIRTPGGLREMEIIKLTTMHDQTQGDGGAPKGAGEKT